MADVKGRRGKGANAPVSDDVKTSLTLSRKLHSRWQAAASLTGMSANALAVEALDAATKWIVIHDKRKPVDPVKIGGSASDGAVVDPDEEDEAA